MIRWQRSEFVDTGSPVSFALLRSVDSLQDALQDHLNGGRTLLTGRLLAGIGEENRYRPDTLGSTLNFLDVWRGEGTDDDQRNIGTDIARGVAA